MKYTWSNAAFWLLVPVVLERAVTLNRESQLIAF